MAHCCSLTQDLQFSGMAGGAGSGGHRYIVFTSAASRTLLRTRMRIVSIEDTINLCAPC